jgi:hypothetical protein
VCLAGACRPRACADVDCPGATVCQGGPLCVGEADAAAPICSDIGCVEGYVCQEGPLCRDPREDQDGDGAPSQLDCDDGNADRYPGNLEICDGVDNDCDGEADDDAPCLEGRRCCGSAGCVNPATNRDHCGGCGRACQIYEECDEAACGDAPAPEVTGVSPDPLPTGVWFGRDDVAVLTIAGRHLLGYATVRITSADGTATAPPFEVVTSGSGRSYVLDQPHLIDGARLPAGPATLVVDRNDGAVSAPFAIVVAGAARPIVTSVSPDPLPVAAETTVSAYGTGFWGAPRFLVAAAAAGAEWVELPVAWVTETWVRTDIVALDPTAFRAGSWLAVVRNPDGAESEPFGFTIDAAPPPVATRLTPTEARIGDVAALEIAGFDFFGRPMVELTAAEDPETPLLTLEVAVADRRRLVTADLNISPAAFEPGLYSVWVVNPDEARSNPLRLTVLE